MKTLEEIANAELIAGARQILTEIDSMRLDPLHPLMVHTATLRHAIGMQPPIEKHTQGEWMLGDRIWIEDHTHYTHGAQRFTPISSKLGGATIALVLDDEGDPECQHNAKLMRAAPTMLQQLREAAAYCKRLNGGLDGDGARSPDGDDFNEIMGWVDAAIYAYEGGK